jgi:hypothetical protein
MPNKFCKVIGEMNNKKNENYKWYSVYISLSNICKFYPSVNLSDFYLSGIFPDLQNNSRNHNLHSSSFSSYFHWLNSILPKSKYKRRMMKTTTHPQTHDTRGHRRKKSRSAIPAADPQDNQAPPLIPPTASSSPPPQQNTGMVQFNPPIIQPSYPSSAFPTISSNIQTPSPILPVLVSSVVTPKNPSAHLGLAELSYVPYRSSYWPIN